MEIMGKNRLTRRTFLKGAGLVTMAVAGGACLPKVLAAASSEEYRVPNSSGTEPPKLKAPANSADCHIHIYDPRFEPPVADPSNATVQDYRLLQKRIGLKRVVIVTPRNYVTNNSVTLDAIRQLGPNARGVGVIRPAVTNVELKILDEGGIRGIRFTVSGPDAVVSTDMIEPLAKRIADLGWHVQLNIPAQEIVANADMLLRLPTSIVIDHMGKLPLPAGVDHPAYRVIRMLIDQGRTWVKVSGADLNTKIGSPTYSDAAVIAKAYIKAAPERMVWGSNWPHPGQKETTNDALLFDLFGEWVPDEATRHRILVTNPEALYGFAKSA
jgi:D-galactarolactone isomerase